MTQEISVEREVMEFDVIIVGAGPAGLAAACRLRQLAANAERELSVAVLEKGAEVGAHVLSGALLDPRALDELFPDWQTRSAPVSTAVTKENVYLLASQRHAIPIPSAFVPPSMHNQGSYVVSAGELCRWLGKQAEALGVDIFPGFAAQSLALNEHGHVKGVITGDMGLDEQGIPCDDFTPGIRLEAPLTLFAEGSRGHLGKALVERFQLDHHRDPQHYAIGFKELWEVPESQHRPGEVVHASGWPLSGRASGGSFLYHAANRQVMVGLIVDLDYRNPHLSPFDEFQRMKHHPLFAEVLKGGTRIAYGARSITKGGLNSLPKMTFPGGMLIGCNAGTLDFSRIKGIHTAMKSGMAAAESAFEALKFDDAAARRCPSTTDLEQRFRNSWAYDSLQRTRSFGPALHRLGTLIGGGWNLLDQWTGGKWLPTLHDRVPDYQRLRFARDTPTYHYPAPDGILSFDRLSSVYLTNIQHDDRQPCHLTLTDPLVPIRVNLPLFDEPAQRYCPASVYEVITSEDGPRFQINAANCIHCKTCDIKDPARNITWTPPEGGSGPHYPNM